MSRWMATMPAELESYEQEEADGAAGRTDAQRKSVSRKRNAKGTSSCPLTVKT